MNRKQPFKTNRAKAFGLLKQAALWRYWANEAAKIGNEWKKQKFIAYAKETIELSHKFSMLEG